jgi:hypothetical protein
MGRIMACHGSAAFALAAPAGVPSVRIACDTTRKGR